MPIKFVTASGPPNSETSCLALDADLVSSHNIARLRGLWFLSRVTTPSCCAAIEIASILEAYRVLSIALAKASHQFSGSVSLAPPERKTLWETLPVAFISPLSNSFIVLVCISFKYVSIDLLLVPI